MTQQEAVQAIVAFAIQAKLANLTTLEVFSEGFTEKILSADVKLEAQDYQTILEAWSSVASLEQRTVQAIDLLDGLTLASAQGQAGGAAKLAAPHPGVWGKLRDKASGFFGWVGTSGQRSRDRVVQITSNMTPQEREQIYKEWRDIYPDSPAKARDVNDFYNKLQAGEFDAEAGRIHSQFLDISNTGEAPRYGQLAQDKNLLPGQIAFEEGKEGLQKGAEFEVEASFAALGGRFPGLDQGRKLAEKTQKYGQMIKDVYDDPDANLGQSIGDLVKEEVKEQTAGRLGKYLDKEVSDTLGQETADTIAMLSGLATGFDKPSDLVGAAADYGIARITDPNVAVSVAIKGGPEGDGPSLVVHVGDAATNGMVLPDGEYTIQAFDRTGKRLAQAEVEIKRGWEHLVDTPEQAAKRPPRPKATSHEVGTLLAPLDAAEIARMPADFKYVLKETRINPRKASLDGPPLEPRNAGSFTKATVEGDLLAWQTKRMWDGQVSWDYTFTFSITTPKEILPGKPAVFTAQGKVAGMQSCCSIQGEFFFQFGQKGETTGIGLYPSDPKLPREGSATASIVLSQPGAPTFTLSALARPCTDACIIEWVYERKDLKPTEVKIRDTKEPVQCSQLGTQRQKDLCEYLKSQWETAEEIAASLKGPPKPCGDLASPEERETCEAAKASQSGDPQACQRFSPGSRISCLLAIAVKKRAPDLIKEFGDKALGYYVAMTRDFSVLPRFMDPYLRDGAYLSPLIIPDPATDDPMPAPPNYCDGLRVNRTVDKEGRWIDEDGSYEDSYLRVTECATMVGLNRALALGDLAECDRAVANISRPEVRERFGTNTEEFRTEDGPQLVKDCRQAVSDIRAVARLF